MVTTFRPPNIGANVVINHIDVPSSTVADDILPVQGQPAGTPISHVPFLTPSAGVTVKLVDQFFYLHIDVPVGTSITSGINIIQTAVTTGQWTSQYRLNALVTVSGTLGSPNVSTYALDTGSIPSGFSIGAIKIHVLSTGIISGAGASSPSGTGGNAINLQVPTTIINEGIIQGGAGGGQSGNNGVFGAGAGAVPGVGVGDGFGGQQVVPTTVYGAGWAHDSASSKSNNGGQGGGWVNGTASGYSNSTDGWGAYSPLSGNNLGGLDGGGSPGYALTGAANLLAGSSLGNNTYSNFGGGTGKGYGTITPPVIRGYIQGTGGSGSFGPTISSFVVTPATTSTGNTYYVYWSVAYATSISIASSLGGSPFTSTNPSGAWTQTASANATYTLTATGNGSSTANATFTLAT